LNNFNSKVTITNSKITSFSSELYAICPKCKTRIAVSAEQLQNEDTYSCPQCGAIYHMAPLLKSFQDALERKGQHLHTISELTITCSKCQTRIPVSDEQLQSEETFSCPQCGAIYHMAPLRKAMQDAREDRKSKYNIVGAGHKEINKETGELSGPESDPDYYLKEFKPLWKLFTLSLIISCGILLPAMILINVFWLNTIYYPYLFFPLIAVGIIGGLYLGYKVRCPSCDCYLLGWGQRGGFWPLTGRCGSCGVRLKNRSVSDRTVMIIRITLLTLMIAIIFMLFYRWLNLE
jgi:predicted RNA-binding Zn-ribbon protein involved in translation (DUF1610 family)